MKQMNQKILELKYKQLLKNHKKLAKDTMRCIETNTILRKLIIDLANHMNLTDIGSFTPEEITEIAKERISKINLVN